MIITKWVNEYSRHQIVTEWHASTVPLKIGPTGEYGATVPRAETLKVGQTIQLAREKMEIAA